MKGKEKSMYSRYRNTGNKVLAFLLAFAMVLSFLPLAGIGRIAVKAEATDITFYYYHECNGDNKLALSTWTWNGIKPDAQWLGKSANGTDYYVFEQTDNTSWYKINLSYDKEASETDYGIEVAEVSVEGEKVTVYSSLNSFDPLWGNNTELYNEIFESGFTDPAFKDGTVDSYAVLSQEGDTGDDEQQTKKVRFYYYNDKPEYVPAYQPWGDNDSVSIIPAIVDGIIVKNGHTVMTQVAEGSNWYYIDIQCDLSAYQNSGVGFSILWDDNGEALWGDDINLGSENDIYTQIFNGTYKDPAYKNGTLGSYAQLSAAKTKEDVEALLITIPDYDNDEFESNSRNALKSAVEAAEAYLADESTGDPDEIYHALETALNELKYYDKEIVVQKVEGIDDDFIKGVDISSYLSLTKSGVKFYNFEGQEVDAAGFFKLFADSGVNYVRLRVWNDPKNAAGEYYGGGNNDLETTKIICSQIAAYNNSDSDKSNDLKVLIDFHYSDFWVDPDKQKAPKAWADMSLADKAAALKAFTTESLTQIMETGVEVGMVQIGNETNNGICGETGMENPDDGMCVIFKAGCEAIDKFNQDNGTNILKVVHFTDPHKDPLYIAKTLQKNEVGYDVYATSYYPYWHGTTSDLGKVLKNIAAETGKMVMVAETQEIYTNADGDGFDNQAYEGKSNIDTSAYSVSLQGQANEFRDVVNAVASAGDLGIGVFYWEPAWLPVGYAYNEDGTKNESVYAQNQQKWRDYGSGWAAPAAEEFDESVKQWGYGGTNCENAALFDFFGHPLASLKVFKYVNYGTAGAAENYYGYSFDVTSVTAKVGMTASELEALLPKNTTVTTNYGTSEVCAVTWNQTELQKIAAAITSNEVAGNTYMVTGTITFADAAQTVNMQIEVIPVENRLVNGDFEDGNTGWEFGNYTYTKEDPTNSKGNISCELNTWNITEPVPYSTSVKQTVTITEPGYYSLIGFAEGNSGVGDTSLGEAIYLQVTDGTGKVYTSANLELKGWMIWQKASIGNIQVTQAMIDAGTNTLEAAWMLTLNADRWGTLDDTYLFKTQDISSDSIIPPSASQPSTGQPSTGTQTTPGDATYEAVEKEDGSKQIVDSNGNVVKDAFVTTADGVTYYANADGTVAAGQIITVDGRKYAAKTDGAIAKQEFYTIANGDIVYATADGSLAANQIVTVGGKKYFAKEDSVIAKSGFYTTAKGNQIYATASGELVVNKVFTVEGKKYFAQSTGAIARSGFYKTAKGNQIYAKASGEVVANKSVRVNGKIYYATATGAIAKSGFYTAANGKKIYAKASGALAAGGSFRVNGDRYYANKNGVIVVSKWIKIGNKQYYCNASGKITKTRKVK